MVYIAAANHNSSLSLIANIMISFASFQFAIIVLYHFLTFTCHFDITGAFVILKKKLAKMYCTKTPHQRSNNFVQSLNIPDRAYNYNEYREGRVSDDFNN